MELTEKWKLTIRNNANFVVKGNQIKFHNSITEQITLPGGGRQIQNNSRKKCFVGIRNVLPAVQKLPVPGSNHQVFTKTSSWANPTPLKFPSVFGLFEWDSFFYDCWNVVEK